MPAQSTTGEYYTFGDDEPINVTLDTFPYILFRSNSERSGDRLEGLQTVEDWHAKVFLLGVC